MAFEDQGEALADRTEELSFNNPVPSECLASFQNRMVVEGAGHTFNWAKWGELISGFHVAKNCAGNYLLCSFSLHQAMILEKKLP
jgi:hypothetical protein